MKSQTVVEDRIRHLLSAELTRRVMEAESRLPHHCVHNHRQPLDTRKTVEDMPNDTFNRTTDRHGLPVVSTIGLCMLGADNPEAWPGNICEDPIDAQRCPYFVSTVSKQTVLSDFETNIRDPGWVQQHMPEMYGLLWILDSEGGYELPWWKRLWFKMLRIRVAPMITTESAIALLPPET